MNQVPFDIGDEIEWIIRPLGDSGYLKGIVTRIGARKVCIVVTSPKTGEQKQKWVESQNLRINVEPQGNDAA